MGDGDVLEKADSLMQRHRTFIAGAARSTLPDAEQRSDGDDLPVLTEVIGSETLAPAVEVVPGPAISPERVASMARELLFERLPGQRQALVEELAAWLDNELPQVVMRVLDGVIDQLIAQVTVEARAVLLPRLQAALEAEAESQPSQDAG